MVESVKGKKLTLNESFYSVNDIREVLPKVYLKIPQVIRLKIPTPLHYILLLLMAKTFVSRSFHVELKVSPLIEQCWWRPVCWRRCTLR